MTGEHHARIEGILGREEAAECQTFFPGVVGSVFNHVACTGLSGNAHLVVAQQLSGAVVAPHHVGEHHAHQFGGSWGTCGAVAHVSYGQYGVCFLR